MYKTSLPKESITFVEPKDDKEDIILELKIIRNEYRDLKKRYDELKQRYVKQNNELLEYMKGEKHENNTRESETRITRH